MNYKTYSIFIGCVLLVFLVVIPRSRLWANGNTLQFGESLPNQVYGNAILYSGDISKGYDVYITLGNAHLAEIGQTIIMYKGNKFIDKVIVYQKCWIMGGVWAKSVGMAGNTAGHSLGFLSSAASSL